MSEIKPVRTVQLLGWRVNVTIETAVLSLALGAGALIRVLPLMVTRADAPYRLGGLYMEFARQIALNGFSFPAWIPYYTQGGIPFAYPPLPFFLAAGLAYGLGLPVFLVSNGLPALAAVLSVPAYYLLLRSLRFGRWVRLAGLAIFATLPSAYQQQIEGAGLAEAFGTLAIILLLAALARAFWQPTPVRFVWVGLALGLCVLSAPGSAVAAVPAIGVFVGAWLFRNGLRGLGQVLLYTAGAGLLGVGLSLPYWLHIAGQYGLGLLPAAMAAQGKGVIGTLANQLYYSLGLPGSGAKYPALWNALLLGGMVWALYRRRFDLLGVYLAFANIPREGDWLVSVPAALLMALGLVKLWLPFARRLGEEIPARVRGRRALEAALPAAALLIGLYHVNLHAVRPARDALPAFAGMAEVAAGVQAHTPAGAQLVVVAQDEALEWTPFLFERTVANMRFGAEWLPEKLARLQAFADGLSACKDWTCVRAEVQGWGMPPGSYALVDRTRIGGSGAYRLVWEFGEVRVVCDTMRRPREARSLESRLAPSGRPCYNPSPP